MENISIFVAFDILLTTIFKTIKTGNNAPKIMYQSARIIKMKKVIFF